MTTTTTLTYLTDTAMLRQMAIVIGKGTDERGDFIISDVTPAYPQGGGQEADNGTIICGSEVFHFSDVRYFEGTVKHYIKSGVELLSDGMNIEIIVDENRRKKNSILHSAGHLIASVAFKHVPDLTPTKGHHFSERSYIELSGELKTNPEEIIARLQQILNKEIKTEKKVSYEMVSAEELKIRCPFIQPGLPIDKPLRVVNIESYFPMGCGGTHIYKLNEIPLLIITKLKSGKGVVRISYCCFKED